MLVLVGTLVVLVSVVGGYLLSHGRLLALWQPYELLIIGAFFSLIPILLLFLAFQRFFIEGMTAGAIKG